MKARDDEEDEPIPRIIDIQPQPEVIQAILMDLAALPIRIHTVNLQMTDNELADAFPALIDGYERIRVNRVTTQESSNLQIYAAKMLDVYNWYTLYLGILHSSGGAMANLLQGKKSLQHPENTPLTFIQ